VFKARAWLLLVLAGLAGVGSAESGLDDPTRPAAGFLLASPRAAELPSLTSMRVAPDRRSAVVNGTAVRLGSSFYGLEVVAIAPGRLTLRRGGELVELKMLSKVKKTSPTVKP
jgi:hypothetical protein